MRLSEIHGEIEAGRGTLPEDQAFATLVAIEHLAQIEGIPVSALDFAAPQFGARFRPNPTSLRGSWGGQAHYYSWRNLILNAQLLFSPGDVDADPWKSLERVGGLWNKRKPDLYHLHKILPSGTHPREVTDALLKKVHGETSPMAVRRLRIGLNNLRKLFQNDLALRTGLLPEVCPGPLPWVRRHSRHKSMSFEITSWRNGLSDLKIAYALDYLHRLAIDGGRLNGETDTLDELRVALCDLPSLAAADVRSDKENALRVYVNLVRHALGGLEPRTFPSEQAQAGLQTVVRASGYETSHPWDVGKPAAARVLFSHGGPSERAGAELEELMEFMNAAAPTRRTFRVAVGVLTDAMGRPELSLKEILKEDMSKYDLGRHEPRRKLHTDKIRNLREFLELPWTPAWQALQRAVVRTGMTALNNPVPKVLAWHPGTDPDGLTREWAQRLDRELRSTLTTPPYGRLDLAKTLARQLAAFDGLHEIPAAAGSGLLPPRIGPIR
jgi:hypothetical protein